MKVTIVALGTRGDVQPYIAIGLALAARGHDVRLASGDNFRPLVESYGLSFAPLGIDMMAFINQQTAILESGRNAVLAMRRVVAASGPLLQQIFDATEAACAEADLLASNYLGIAAYSIAEKCGLPFVYASTVPMPGNTRTRPSILMPVQRNLGGPLNMASHRAFMMVQWLLLRSHLNAWRKRIGLAPLRRIGWPFDQLNDQPVLSLYGISPVLFPRPSDWPAHWLLTGSWTLPAPHSWTLPPELRRFLDEGPAPIFVGFGSMTTRDPEAEAALVAEAVRLAGVRAIVSSGWAELAARNSAMIAAVGDMPHDVLFRHVTAVVHHGGVGTTTTALRAGKPSVIVPFFGDQPLWGARVHALGAGPAPIPRKALTAERLAAAIRATIDDPTMERRAQALATVMTGERGADEAAQRIEAVT